MIDFAVAQEGNFDIKGEAGLGKSVVLADDAAKFNAAVAVNFVISDAAGFPRARLDGD